MVCALTFTGTAECWGLFSSSPTGNYTQISAGSQHACGLLAGGAVECWGSNGDGQGADPVGPYTQVSAGSFHTCAIASTGDLDCWGSNNSGALNVPDNVAPTASDDAYATGKNVALVVGAPGVLGNDIDDGLTASVQTPPSKGTLALNPDGSFTYTPNARYVGSDSFTYAATDSHGATDVALVSITVTNEADGMITDCHGNSCTEHSFVALASL